LIRRNRRKSLGTVGTLELHWLAHAVKKSGRTATLIPGEKQKLVILQTSPIRKHLAIMPEMNGYEVLENVRRLEPELGYLPVIAFTAAARDEDRAATRLTGFQAHLAKPIEPDELVRTVLELFNCKKEGRSTV
jgi:two-component system CheB/CheR fusion protein